MITIYFDGGAAPTNPGNAAGACVLVLPDGSKLVNSIYLGITTNNVAEYQGCILGLKGALELDYRDACIYGDSELIIKQLKGEYKVKNPGLKPLHAEATSLLRKFNSFQLQWIPREKNTLADRAATEAIMLGVSG